MKNTTHVPVKNDLLMKLIARSKENYPVAIDGVIKDFLERTADEHDDLPGLRQDGYIWDQLELSTGMQLRTRYYDEWQIATPKRVSFTSEKSPTNASQGV